VVREGRGRGMVTGDLLSRARAGDGEAFRELAESHRRELQVHCYRMLGSFQDAEDALQETMLAAWQGIGGFTEERGSLRTWLYKIATNRCLNVRRAASRRPAREWDMSKFKAPRPTPRDEAVWLQPFPRGSAPAASRRPAPARQPEGRRWLSAGYRLLLPEGTCMAVAKLSRWMPLIGCGGPQREDVGLAAGASGAICRTAGR
jgi:RNA polymerase sigma factor (sigma-70 family)